MRTVWIYGLFDPREPNRIRYVGQTVNRKVRLASHRRERGVTKKCEWVKALREAGVIPAILILQQTDSEHANLHEKEWIQQFEGDGFLNVAIPCVGRVRKTRGVTPEERQRRWFQYHLLEDRLPKKLPTPKPRLDWSVLEGISDELILRILEAERVALTQSETL